MSGLIPTSGQYRERFRNSLKVQRGVDFECWLVTPATIRLTACHLIATGTLDGQRITIYADCQNVRSMPWKVWTFKDGPDHTKLESSDCSLFQAVENFSRDYLRNKRK